VQQAACIALHMLSELPDMVPHLLRQQCRTRMAPAVDAFPADNTIKERGNLALIRYAQKNPPQPQQHNSAAFTMPRNI
jgi:hypothetical protein